MSLLRAFSTVGGYTLLSRITGFIRDILVAGLLGAGTAADAFLVAFKLPNMFRRLFAEGAFSAGFVPLFTRLYKNNEAAARAFADEAFTALTLILFVFCAAMMLAMPVFIYVIAPGFDAIPGKIELAEDLARIAFPYLLFISLVSLQAGVLNGVNKFAAAAATPILLNLTLITALVTFGQGDDTALVLAIAVPVAGIIQFMWLAWHCRRAGLPVGFTRPRLSDNVKTLLKRMLPLIFGVGLYQINLLVDTILASFVADGAVSWLYYADRVTQLPLGVVGVAIGTALLPLLSRQIEADNAVQANDTQNAALLFCLVLTVPAAFGLIVLAEPVTAVLFERGVFLADDRTAVAGALAAFAVGLPAFVMIKAFAPGYFARGDTATPVKAAALALVVNIVLNLILMRFLGHIGIAMATAISSWLNAVLLAAGLARRGHWRVDDAWIRRMTGCVMSALIMAAAVFGGLWIIGDMTSALFGAPGTPAGPEGVRAFVLIALVCLGAAVYVATARLLGVATVADLKSWWRAPKQENTPVLDADSPVG